MKKLNETEIGWGETIDIRQITETGQNYVLTASDEQKQDIANRFDLPKIISLTARGKLLYGDKIVFDGLIFSETERICVVSLDPFVEKNEIPVRIVFSEQQSESASENVDPIEDIVFPVNRGRINLGEALTEEFGLGLNPFPKKEDTYFEYYDLDEKQESPFAVLKKLTKPK